MRAFAVANLTVTLTAPATVNNTQNYTISPKVTNSGTVTAGAITFKTTLPTGLTFVSGSSAGGFVCTAAAQVVTCNRTAILAAAGTDTLAILVNTTKGAAYSVNGTVIGGGDTTLNTSNTVVTTVNLPDLAVASVGQPFYFAPNPANPAQLISTPGLQVNAMSKLPVIFKNVGNTATPVPVEVSIVLPSVLNAAGATVRITAPVKFIYKNWVCLSTFPATNTTVNCTRNIAMASLESVQLQIPITPATGSLNTLPSFQAAVGSNAIAWDPNPANDGPMTTVSATAVKALSLTAYNPNDLNNVPQFYSVSSNIINPASIPKWQNELPNLAHPVYVHTPDTLTYPGTDYYKLDVKQIKAQVLPAGFPSTPVLAYGDPTRSDTYSYPAHTILARSTQASVDAGFGKPVKVSYSNGNLASANSALFPPVDITIHGNDMGEPALRTIAHLHGSKVNNQASDGYPEAWSSPLLPNTSPFPGNPTIPYNPNPFDYANTQESTMLWYHDHTLGMTHNNVYAGLAGAYLVRDDNEVSKMTTSTIAKQLPHPNYEIPLVFQDRMFRTNGNFAYPDSLSLILFPLRPPISVVPEFFGQVMVVNGAAWPYMEVEPRKYRFRMLNGSNSRFYTFALSNGQSFQVLGSDQGFANTPAIGLSTLTIAPGERYDVIIDFAGFSNTNIVLTNSAATVGIPVTSGPSQIMQFRVNQLISTIPDSIALTASTSLRSAALGGVPALTSVATRQVLLFDDTDSYGRTVPSLGNITAVNGLPPGAHRWMDTITETPKANTVELWEIYNDTVDSHPIHLHGGRLQVANHQDFRGVAKAGPVISAVTGLPSYVTQGGVNDTVPYTVSQEKGWKDTVIAPPFTVTRIKVKFEGTGLFAWHCHILEHEDHDMMRPLNIIP